MNNLVEVQDATMREVLSDFCPRFAPKGRTVWISENNSEPIYASTNWLRRSHFSRGVLDLLPNVVILDATCHRLWLIDVMTLGRQMTPQRRATLLQTLRRSRGYPLFVSALRDRRQFHRLLADCPWGTIAWFANHPGHLVHFDDDPRSALLARGLDRAASR